MSGLELKPLLDYIAVEVLEEQRASGLHVVGTVDPGAPKYAKVLAVGPGRPSEYSGALVAYCGFGVGDTVLMHGGAGVKFPQGLADVRFITPRDLIAVR